MPTITLGTGGDQTTLSGAWSAASSGDTIQFISDVTNSGANVSWSNKDNIEIDGQGYTLTFDSGAGNWGDGIVLRECNGIYFHDLTITRIGANPPTSTGYADEQYGSAIALSSNASYVLVQGCDISRFHQAGVNSNPGSFGGNPGTGASYLWVDNCDIHDINEYDEFYGGPSCVSTYQPAVVAGASAPSWWTSLLGEFNLAGRTAGDMVFGVTRCRLSNIKDNGASTDGNGVILDDWKIQQTGHNPGLPDFTNGSRWALIEANSMYNCQRSAARAFNSPGPHVFRNNTSVNCAQENEQYTAHYMLGDQGNAQYTYNALISNNCAKDGNIGFTNHYSTTNGTIAGSTWTNNAAHEMSSANGVGVSVTANPNLQSLTDVSDFYPLSGSPLLGAGATPNSSTDQVGTTRPNPPSIGALELPTTPGTPGTNASLYTDPCGTAAPSRTTPSPTGAGSTVNITTKAQMDNYVATGGTPGDAVLLDPTVDLGPEYNLAPLSGTSSNPIIISSNSLSNSFKVTGLGSGVTTNNSFGLSFAGTNYVEVWGAEISELGTWGILTGPGYNGHSISGSVGCAIRWCYIHDIGNEAIRGFNFTNAEIYYNQINATGLSGSGYGYAIVFGNSDAWTPFNPNTNDITILKNRIHQTDGAVKIYTGCKDITVKGNWVKDPNPDSSHAAIDCAAHNNIGAVNIDLGGVDSNISIRSNIVWSADGTGGGIATGQDNGISIIDNIVHSDAGEGIFQSSGPNLGAALNAGGNATRVLSNTVYATTGSAYDIGGSWTSVSNIDDDGTAEHTALAGDFVGPLTGDFNAGDGPGSALKLDSGSSLNTAGGGGAALDICELSFGSEAGAFSGDYVPPADLTVGIGGNYSTLGAAWTAASDGDTIRIVSNYAQPSESVTGKNDITIQGDGYTVTFNTQGYGWFFTNSRRIRIKDLDLVQSEPGGTTGAGIVMSTLASYFLVENVGFAYWNSGAVLSFNGDDLGFPGTGADRIWVDNCRVHDLNPQNTAADVSAFSFGTPTDNGGAAPSWWTAKLTAFGQPNDANLAFALTRCKVWDLDTGGPVTSRGLEIWDWNNTTAQGSDYTDGSKYCFVENNIFSNVVGNGIRSWESRGPHFIRNNTFLLCGQIFPESVTGNSAAIHITDGQGGLDHGAVVISNLAYDCGGGFADTQSYGVNSTSSVYSNNAGYSNINGNGLGVSVTDEPQLNSYTDPFLSWPLYGSPLSGAGFSPGPVLDSRGVIRPAPPAIGAYEPAEQPADVSLGIVHLIT